MKPIATFSIVAYDPNKKEWGVGCSVEVSGSGSGCFMGQGGQWHSFKIYVYSFKVLSHSFKKLLSYGQ